MKSQAGVRYVEFHDGRDNLFKSHRDDTRDSQAVKVVNRPLSIGVAVGAYDRGVNVHEVLKT